MQARLRDKASAAAAALSEALFTSMRVPSGGVLCDVDPDVECRQWRSEGFLMNDAVIVYEEWAGPDGKTDYIQLPRWICRRCAAEGAAEHRHEPVVL